MSNVIDWPYQLTHVERDILDNQLHTVYISELELEIRETSTSNVERLTNLLLQLLCILVQLSFCTDPVSEYIFFVIGCYNWSIVIYIGGKRVDFVHGAIDTTESTNQWVYNESMTYVELENKK